MHSVRSWEKLYEKINRSKEAYQMSIHFKCTGQEHKSKNTISLCKAEISALGCFMNCIKTFYCDKDAHLLFDKNMTINCVKINEGSSAREFAYCSFQETGYWICVIKRN